MDLKDIKAIVDLMKKNALSEFELEHQDFKIKLKRGPGAVAALPDDPPIVAVSPLPTVTLPQVVPGAVAAVPQENLLEIKSPMIGTVYRAPSPESPEYVQVGAEVNPETVVCIIEAMKVMNEIKAEVKGVVTQVLIENAKPVEFGQPLFKIRPN